MFEMASFKLAIFFLVAAILVSMPAWLWLWRLTRPNPEYYDGGAFAAMYLSAGCALALLLVSAGFCWYGFTHS